MKDVLAVAEQRDGSLRSIAHEVVSEAAKLARALGGGADALVVGSAGSPEGVETLGGFGARRVRVAAAAAFEPYVGEVVAPVVAEAVASGGYGAVVFGATAEGRDLAPRVAALLDRPLVTDVTGWTVSDGAVRWTKPVYAGKAFATVAPSAGVALASLRPNAFGAEQVEGGEGTVEPFSPTAAPVAEGVVVRGREASGTGARDVSEATIVVSGGRGMRGPEEWGLLEALRDALGPDAALGASRAVVDAGWRPHGEQVGQTGKTVAPKLYFAIGISGAIQHLAGMRTAGVIVAVNKDPDAPIFQVADYGIVGDLFEIVPRLTSEVAALTGSG